MSSSYPSAQSNPKTAPLSVRSFLTRLIGGAALLNLFIFTMLGLSIQHSRKQYQEWAEITTQNLTQTLENDIAGAIRTDDLALLSVIDEYQRQGATGAVDGEKLNAYIERLRARLPEIASLRATDAQGTLVYGIDVIPGAHTSVADRAYFMQLRADAKAGLVISKPLVGRITQKWAIVLARRVDQPDGSFGGIVLATISLEYLSQEFSALNVGGNGVIVLRDEDLGVIVRYPELGSVGSAAGSQVMARELKELISAQRSSGTITVRSSLDHVERAYSYRKVGSYPLYILVGLATEDYLSVWRNNATEQAALVAIFTLITLLSTWLIYRTWHRKAKLIEALARQEVKFRTVADFTFDWEYWQGTNHEILYVTPACERVTGYSQAEFVADPDLLLRLIHSDDRHVMDRHLDDIACQDEVLLDFRIVRRDGGTRWITHHCRSVCGENGEPMGRRVSNRDVTDRKQTELALLKSKQQFDNLVAKIPVGIYVLHSTPAGTFKLDFASPRMAEILGIDVGDLLADAQALFKMIHPDDLESFVDFNREGIQQQRPFDWKGRILIESEIKWLHFESSPVAQENGDVLWHGLITDITAARRMEEEVRQLAFYDALTKLPNRRLLNDRFGQSISASKRSGFYSALIFLDLDNFKPLNDAHGHVAGDLLLIEVASRLKNCVREIDTVARVGGDEFVVLLSYLNADKVESTSQTEIVAEKIRIALSQPYRLTIRHDAKEDATVEHHCSASIGVVVYSNDEGTHDEILRWADTAMYEAKKAGRNSIRFYDLKT